MSHCWNICYIIVDISLAVFRASNCFMMPFIPILRVWIEGNGDGPLVGIGSCFLVKADLKMSFRVFALS